MQSSFIYMCVFFSSSSPFFCFVFLLCPSSVTFFFNIPLQLSVLVHGYFIFIYFCSQLVLYTRGHNMLCGRAIMTINSTWMSAKTNNHQLINYPGSTSLIILLLLSLLLLSLSFSNYICCRRKNEYILLLTTIMHVCVCVCVCVLALEWVCNDEMTSWCWWWAWMRRCVNT